MESILKLTDMDDKQDAVDILFETIEEELRHREEILGKHPHFSKWVERALEKGARGAHAYTKGRVHVGERSKGAVTSYDR